MDDNFIIQAYTKKELALMYFPDSLPRVAVTHLMRWVNMNGPLVKALQEAGYTKSSKWLSPRQVGAIIDHLGEP